VLLDQTRDRIKELFASGHGKTTRISHRVAQYDNWMSILTLHVRLLCEFEPTTVTSEVKRICKENFYPMEECLKIVAQYKQIEAMALLNSKIGSYTQSVQLYLELL
jgi:hypothetical protein